MKARIKPVMLTPYFPKVRTINGTEHRMSREEYRHYMRSTSEHRPQIVAEKAPKKEEDSNDS